MNIINISKNGSNITQISIHYDLHGTYDAVHVMTVGIPWFSDRRSPLTIPNAPNIVLRHFASGPNDESFTLEGGVTHLVELSNALLRCGQINDTDRQQLGQQIQKVQKILENRSLLQQVPCNTAQADVIKFVASPYIDTLVESLPSSKDIVPLIYYLRWFNEGAWRKWLQEHNESQSIDIETNVACMKDLSIIMQGKMDISSALRQNGTGIPTIEYQRQALIEGIIESFKNKYGNLGDNEFEEFYIELALERLLHNERFAKRLSTSYSISTPSGLPQHIGKRLTIDGSDIKGSAFTESEFLPDTAEEALLKKHGLKRFPISAEDMQLARANASDEIIKDVRELRRLIDGELYPDMTPLEQLVCAIADDESDEIIKIFSTGSFDISTPIGKSDALRIAISGVWRNGIWNNRIQAAKILIHLGADVNAEYSDQSTNLHQAACLGHSQLIRLLLENGAIFRTDKTGRTPLHQYFSRGWANNQRESTLLPERVEIIRLLIASGGITNVDTLFDNDGNNPLHTAAANADRNGILALLEVGASPLAPDINGRTAFNIIFGANNNPLRGDEELRRLLS